MRILQFKPGLKYLVVEAMVVCNYILIRLEKHGRLLG
jgi:hypothetical protein